MAGTLREAVMKAREEGHIVTIYERKDGGIIVKSIDGVKYAQGTGNNALRQLTGFELSTARRNQLTKTFSTRGKKFNKDYGKVPLKQRVLKQDEDEDVWKQLRKVQRLERKQTGGKSKTSIKDVRKFVETNGSKNLKEFFKNKITKAQGFAYAGVIDALIERINMIASFSDYQDEWDEVINYLETHKNDGIRDTDVPKCYEVLYNIENKTADERDGILQIKTILGI